MTADCIRTEANRVIAQLLTPEAALTTVVCRGVVRQLHSGEGLSDPLSRSVARVAAVEHFVPT